VEICAFDAGNRLLAERKTLQDKELCALIELVICKVSHGNILLVIESMKLHKSISLRSRSRRVLSVFSRNYGTLLDADLLLIM
jgi:hypothetical protein